MAASDKRRRGRTKIQSSHVAPPGQREAIARPVMRPVEPVAPPAVKPRRRRDRNRPHSGGSSAATMTERRSDQFDRVLSTRLLSGVILFSLVVVLVLFFQSDAFYVRHIEVGGLYHLTAEEVFTLTDVANTHLFWLDPAVIRENVLRSPSVADAEIVVGWPPHLVQVEVQERDPALIWEQAGMRTWIDVRGRVMQQRSDLENMLRVVVEGVDSPVSANVVISQDVVDGALQLRQLQPDRDVLLYDPAQGLGYQDSRGWRVWFGSGTAMVAKENVYNAIVADLQTRGIQPEFVDVGDINAPYYKIWWREGEAAEEFGNATPESQ